MRTGALDLVAEPGRLYRAGPFRLTAARRQTAGTVRHRLIGTKDMDMLNEVLQMLDDVLGLGGRALQFTADTALLGALPELDSMAVVALVNGMEDRFGISVSDDEISGDTFATVGSLTAYLTSKA
jgi:acyl carrier protein